MKSQVLRQQQEKLINRMRILILQNAREGAVYDSNFLNEMHQVSGELLQMNAGGFNQGPTYESRPAVRAFEAALT